MRGRMLALDLPGQLGQAIQQQWLVLRRGAADGAGQLGQFALGTGQDGAGLARCRQTQQGRHAVGLDLQQTLHETAEPTR